MWYSVPIQAQKFTPVVLILTILPCSWRVVRRVSWCFTMSLWVESWVELLDNCRRINASLSTWTPGAPIWRQAHKMASCSSMTRIISMWPTVPAQTPAWTARTLSCSTRTALCSACPLDRENIRSSWKIPKKYYLPTQVIVINTIACSGTVGCAWLWCRIRSWRTWAPSTNKNEMIHSATIEIFSNCHAGMVCLCLNAFHVWEKHSSHLSRARCTSWYQGIIIEYRNKQLIYYFVK